MACRKYLLIVTMAFGLASMPLVGSAKLRIYQAIAGVEEGQSEAWFLLNKQSTGERFVSQSTSAFPDNPYDMLTLFVRCDENKALRMEMRYPAEIKARGAITYTFTHGSEKINGEVTAQTELEVQSGDAKQLIAAKDRKIVNLNDNVAVILQRLHMSRLTAVTFELKNNGQVYAGADFNPQGFKQAFDFNCSTNSQYALISGHDVKDKIPSPCNDPTIEGECQRPRDHAGKLLDLTSSESEVNALFNYLDEISAERRYSPTIRITGTTDKYITQNIRAALEGFIVRRMREEVISLLGYYDLHIVPGYESDLNTIRGLFHLVVRHGPEASVVDRLKSMKDGLMLIAAIQAHDQSKVEDILNANNNDLSAFDTGQGRLYEVLAPHALLKLSITEGSTETTRLLLAAGANATVTQSLFSNAAPLDLALRYADAETVTLLLEAGAPLENRSAAYFIHAYSPIFVGLMSGDVAKVEALVAHDVPLDIRTRNNWTPLMAALWLNDKAMVDYLLPLSDPFASSERALLTKRLFTTELIDYLPPVNVLFLARRSDRINNSNLEAMVVARAAQMNDAAAVGRSQYNAAVSEGHLALYDGDGAAAVKSYKNAFSRVDISTLDETSDGPTMMAAMDALVVKHMALLIEGKALSVVDRDAISLVTSLGGWNQPLHDLYDVFLAVSKSDRKNALVDWSKEHGDSAAFVWDAYWVRKWIELQSDSVVKTRLSNILNQFVLAQ